MLQTIEAVNSVLNKFIWGVPAMICIIGVGLYLSIRLHFIQFRKFGLAMKQTIGKVFEKTEASDGAMTPFPDLRLHMVTGYLFSQRLLCAVLHSQRLSVGDCMVQDVLNFYSHPR